MLKTPDQFRQELALRGITVADWARFHGFSPAMVHQVLGGKLRCVRGQAHAIAVRLGLKAGLVEGVADLPRFEEENGKCAVSAENHMQK